MAFVLRVVLLSSAALLWGCQPDPAVSLVTSPVSQDPDSPVRLQESHPLAGTTFTIQTVSRDEATARRAIEAAFDEVSRLEGVVSEWQANSQVSAINAAPQGSEIPLSAELFAVLNRAMWFAERTEGAFDPSFAGCAARWSIPERRIPTQADLADCLQRTGYRNILLDAQAPAILLGLPGMRIGLGGIGKGYRVDRAAEILESHGITSFVVNGGGDIRVSAGEFNEPWQVDIVHPRDPTRRLGSLALSNGAIATSGDTSWYFDQEGVRYHHIFDPRTGQPARLSIAVTVVAKRAIDADALATGLFVLGPERSLALLGQMPGYEALLVGQDLATYQTPGFPAINYPEQGD